MKRFHVHISVDDIDENIRFYSRLFGADPSVVKTDYAKWMLEDPRVNFAVSRRGREPGVNHLGLQVDSDDALAELRGRIEAANADPIEQKDAPCCYARSNKYWVTDPSGVPWETFHTLGEIEVFGEDTIQSSRISEPCCCSMSHRRA